MKKGIKTSISLSCLAFLLLSLFISCNSNQQHFMEIQYCTDAYPLKFTGRFRSASFSYDSLSSYNNLYPKLDLSQIERLPVYRYIEDKDSLYERTADFADKLLMDISKMTDETKDASSDVYYVGSDADMQYSLLSSENSVSLYAKTDYNFASDIVNTQMGSYPFMLDYEVNESGFVLPEDTVQLYKDNARELLKKLHNEDYTESDISISIYPYMEDTDYLKNHEYTITITLSYYPSKSGENYSDTVLEFYSLDSHISLDIVYHSKSGFDSVRIREYSSDWLNEIGQYEIIPYSEAQALFDNDDNVRYGNDDYAHDPVTDIPDETWDYYANSDTVKDYGMYLVYVKDKEGYIRPLYMKQDYYSVGRMEGAAWIDAIDY